MGRSYLNRIQVPGFPATVGAMTRREPAQARSRATRDAVLDAASRLAELDPALLQAATIAGEAGIGTGTTGHGDVLVTTVVTDDFNQITDGKIYRIAPGG